MIEQQALSSRPALADSEPRPAKWQKWLIRMLAFFIKEVNEMRRQPKLLVSLVGGPFLVLLLFGITFRTMSPIVETILVLPERGVSGLDETQIRQTIGLNFTLVDMTTDFNHALARLQANEVDLIQIVPPDVQQRVIDGDPVTLDFRSNTIDPTVEAWIQYLAYAEVNEVNKFLLQSLAETAQTEAVQLQIRLGEAQEPLARLNAALSPAELQKTKETLQTLRQDLTAWETHLPPPELQIRPGDVQESLVRLNPALSPGELQQTQETLQTLRQDLGNWVKHLPPANQSDTADDTQIGLIYQSINQLQTGLLSVETSIDSGEIRQQAALIRAVTDEINRLDGYINIFVGVPPDRIVSPVQLSYANLRGSAYSTVVFHAPGVLALLIQHVAITLGALALVRERLSGTFELFRVAPLNSVQLLLGKYLGYTLFVSVTSLALVLLMRLIKIPLQGSLLDFAGLLLLTTLASLGIGFVISLVSNSDLQAIQYTMLALLLSVFFSGIFLPLEAFQPVAQYISNIIPMKHGVQG
ncbi:MAG TPA: ABC transporter permease, partial [Anaerolineae bacterium]|nr:ABC transporter permease [Anaerolineae bacterium]